MRTDDTTWFVTTEVEAALELPNGKSRTLHLKIASFPPVARDVFELTTWQGDEATLVIDDRSYEVVDKYDRGSHLLQTFAYNLTVAQGLSEEDTQIWELLRELPVPAFGSPPRAFIPIGVVAAEGSGAIIKGVGSHPLTYVLIFAGGTMFLNIAGPPTRAIGRGLSNKVDSFFGTRRPPKAAVKKSKRKHSRRRKRR